MLLLMLGKASFVNFHQSFDLLCVLFVVGVLKYILSPYL